LPFTGVPAYNFPVYASLRAVELVLLKTIV
jgi:hypothetical protein